MRIILDWVDWSGKSTLAEFLSEKLWRTISHFSYPKTADAFMEYAPSYTPATADHIFDRSWLDEIVYGPLKWRPWLQKHDYNFFQDRTKDDLYIICDTSIDRILQSFAERGEDYINEAEARAVHEFFRTTAMDLIPKNHTLVYDMTVDGQNFEQFLELVKMKMVQMENPETVQENGPQEITEDDVEIEKAIEDPSEVAEVEEGTKEVETKVDESKNVYNTTDLDPVSTFERHVFHRDQFAHYLRWSFVLKYLHNVRDNLSVCDFGCGKWNLYEVLYRNRFSPKFYLGLDIRKKTIEKAQEKFPKATFIAEDLITLENKTDLTTIKADVVTSFEVIEHVGKRNALKFLENFKECGNEGATYFLSTPNYDPEVGAADNHTYPDYEGGIPVPQEFDHGELMDLINEAGFDIVERVGTFASIRDYKDFLDVNPEKKAMFDILRERLDSNVLSVVMAPLVPAELARNCLWVLKRTKQTVLPE